jgi:predicted Ser/Thr protein kinase
MSSPMSGSPSVLTLTKSPSATLANSDMLDGVELQEKIGEGHYGFVYRGRWQGSVVAVKEIKAQEAIQAFIEEAGVLK